METMHPVVLRGRTGGSAQALPREEFTDRVSALQEAIARGGFAAAAVFGDSRDYGPLCYVSGYIPMLRWAVALVPASGDPSLFLAAPSRDMAFTRLLTWIEDVQPVSALRGALDELSRTGTVALVGAERMRGSVRRQIDGAGHLVEADALLSGRMSTPRPREVALLRTADALVGHAADQAEHAYAEGRGATEALAVAERAAREQGAHDVRALYSPDGGRSLRTFETAVAGRPTPNVFYLAVEVDGYWGETFRSVGADGAVLAEVRRSLEAVAAELHPGLAVGHVIERLGRPPDRTRQHPAVSGRRAVARLGLSRDDAFGARPGAELVAGVYSLRAGCLGGTGVLLSKTVAVGLAG